MTQINERTNPKAVRLRIVDGGHFRLDGGTMFGVVPRAIWERLMPPDADNCIRMACWCVLVEIGEQRVLIETGMGTDYDAKEREIYGLTGEWVGSSLEAIGVSPTSIDVVVLTHLHFDHAAGLTRRVAGSDDYEPVFPNAEVVVQDGEWASAMTNHSTTKSSYRPEALRVLEGTGRLRRVTKNPSITDGVAVRVTPGHTRYHQSVVVTGPNRTACFVGELLPTVHHARTSYQMAYDLDPMETIRQKAALMDEAEAGNWLLLLDHDSDHPMVTVGRDERGRRRLEPVADREKVLGGWITL